MPIYLHEFALIFLGCSRVQPSWKLLVKDRLMFTYTVLYCKNCFDPLPGFKTCLKNNNNNNNNIILKTSCIGSNLLLTRLLPNRWFPRRRVHGLQFYITFPPVLSVFLFLFIHIRYGNKVVSLWFPYRSSSVVEQNGAACIDIFNGMGHIKKKIIFVC